MSVVGLDGQVGTPKGGRLRHVPLTRRRTAALAEHRHLALDAAIGLLDRRSAIAHDFWR